MNDKSPPIVLTGIKPTGRPHLGNYVGMIRPAISLIGEFSGNRNFLFIADYHALNSIHDPSLLKSYSYDIAATLLACGLDVSTTIFYRQSDVPETFELATILATVTPKGLMNRAHAYKAAVDRNKNAGIAEIDSGVNMGLYTYPILMAADILLFDTSIVPVGKDQVQHVEFARDIAGFFNNKYGPVFRLPQHSVREEGAAIPGLDGRKMSKSYGNTIPLFEAQSSITALVKKMITDSKLPSDAKDPHSSSIFQLFLAFSSKEESDTLRDAFEKGGLSYGEAKRQLTSVIIREIGPLKLDYDRYMADLDSIDILLRQGAAKAREIAAPVLARVKAAVGR